MANKTKTKLIKLLNKVCCNICKDQYCLLKEIIVCSHQDARWLVQLKVIEKFKWLESEKDKKDIGWEEAHLRWISAGYAKKFSELYNDEEEEVNPEELYKKITT